MKQKRIFFLANFIEEKDNMTNEEWDWIEENCSYAHSGGQTDFAVPIPPKELIKVLKIRCKDASERIQHILHAAALENDTGADGYVQFFSLT
ncbi:MAG TPA: hypothetical protein VMX17_00575 [Candidatus Glassbacteria bacterium]|nr:hypothetical protein [Candidatus Glassbacteria bacterium]